MVVIGKSDKMPTQAHPDMDNAVRMKVGFNGYVFVFIYTVLACLYICHLDTIDKLISLIYLF